MIVKILKSSKSFAGVTYNTNKIDKGKGELMRVANFGPLQGLSNLKPRDYINYLEMLSGLNERIELPQFHTTISGKGNMYDKQELTEIAGRWLKEMGYAEQPNLVVFHKDTGNNHVHIVSTRIGRNGEKISSAFEHIRALKSMNKVLGYDFAMKYRFSTRAQFFMILESKGYMGKDPDEVKLQERISKFRPDKKRVEDIRSLLMQLKNRPDYKQLLKEKYEIDLVFHSSGQQKPYGYSIIDHDQKNVFKGSEVLPLKQLVPSNAGDELQKYMSDESSKAQESSGFSEKILSIGISDDVDDQQIHGMRRRRQKKARTNTR